MPKKIEFTEVTFKKKEKTEKKERGPKRYSHGFSVTASEFFELERYFKKNKKKYGWISKNDMYRHFLLLPIQNDFINKVEA